MYVSLSPFDEITVHVFRIDLFIVEKCEDVQRKNLRLRSMLPLIRLNSFPAPVPADWRSNIAGGFRLQYRLIAPRSGLDLMRQVIVSNCVVSKLDSNASRK